MLCRRKVQGADVRIYYEDIWNALNLGNEMNGGGVPNFLLPQATELKWLAQGQPHASSVVRISGTILSTDYVLNPDRIFFTPTGI